MTATSFAEFTGLWKRDAASDLCLPAFPYNTAYYYRLRDISVAIRNSNLDATIAFIAYGDAGCTTKQGLVTETFALNTQPAALSGRTNVVKGDPVMTASSIGADGGLGLSLTKMPDGTASELKGRKFTADVDSGRLLVTTSADATTLDSAGYPSALVLSDYFVR